MSPALSGRRELHAQHDLAVGWSPFTPGTAEALGAVGSCGGQPGDVIPGECQGHIRLTQATTMR